MLNYILAGLLGVLVGGGAVLVYLHKHTASAVHLAASAAQGAAAAVKAVADIKAKL